MKIEEQILINYCKHVCKTSYKWRQVSGFLWQCVEELKSCVLIHACIIFGEELCQITTIFTQGLRILFGVLKVKQCCWLTKLDLPWFSLTKKCMTSLCGALGDEHCRLNKLNLAAIILVMTM